MVVIRSRCYLIEILASASYCTSCEGFLSLISRLENFKALAHSFPLITSLLQLGHRLNVKQLFNIVQDLFLVVSVDLRKSRDYFYGTRLF